MISSYGFCQPPCFDADVALKSFHTFDQPNVIEEDTSSVSSSISFASSEEWSSDYEEWSSSDEDDEEMPSVNAAGESDQVHEEMQSMNEDDTDDTSSDSEKEEKKEKVKDATLEEWTTSSEEDEEMSSMNAAGEANQVYEEMQSMNENDIDDTSPDSETEEKKEKVKDAILEEWTTSSEEDDEEMSSMNAAGEADQVYEEMQSMNENDIDDTSPDSKTEEKKEKVKDPTLEDNHIIEENARSYKEMVKRFQASRPPFSQWITSWTKKTTPAWLNVYGYYNKNKHYGGYGVILRNDLLHPIAAAIGFTPQEGQSQFSQVLDGLKTGFELALQHGFSRLDVGCNVQKAVDLLGSSSFKRAGKCFVGAQSTHVKIKGICLDCTKRLVFVKSTSLKTLIPVIKDLKDLQAKVDQFGFLFKKLCRDQNEAAHYLAKMAKRNEHGVYSKEINPPEFPVDLKKILWSDAYGCDTKYSLSLIG